MDDLSEFVASSVCVLKPDGSYSVYVDGENLRGEVMNCQGNTDFERKEDALNYIRSLRENIEDDLLL